MPQLSGHAAFHARVAGNVLDILAREMELAPGFNRAETARLESLLGETGTLKELNRKLCDKIASGEMDLSNENLKNPPDYDNNGQAGHRPAALSGV